MTQGSPLILSFGEYRALVAKAFRGAGYSWGLAEDAAFAAKRLTEFGAGAEIVVRLLEYVDDTAIAELMPDQTWRSTGDALCPICVGVSLVDLDTAGQVAMGSVREPLLIAPFLELLSREHRTGYVMEWPGGRCDIAAGAITVVGDAATVGAVTINRRHITATRAELITRAALSPATTQALESFAHRVYAPATEQSRSAGAGE